MGIKNHQFLTVKMPERSVECVFIEGNDKNAIIAYEEENGTYLQNMTDFFYNFAEKINEQSSKPIDLTNCKINKLISKIKFNEKSPTSDYIDNCQTKKTFPGIKFNGLDAAIILAYFPRVSAAAGKEFYQIALVEDGKDEVSNPFSRDALAAYLGCDVSDLDILDRKK